MKRFWISVTTEQFLLRSVEDSLYSELENLLDSEHSAIIVESGGILVAISGQCSKYWTFNPLTASKYDSFDSFQSMIRLILSQTSEDKINKIFRTKSTRECNSGAKSLVQMSEESRLEQPRFVIPLEELRAVQECKRKSRRNRSKKQKSEKNIPEAKTCDYHSPRSISESSVDFPHLDNSSIGDIGDRDVNIPVVNDRPVVDYEGFELEVQNIHLEHSEGEDSGYAECSTIGDHSRNMHQQQQQIEAEIQKRLQREMHFLRQQMELKLHAEKMRIEQELRQEMLQKQKIVPIPIAIQPNNCEEKQMASKTALELPPHQYEKTKGFADMSGEQYEIKMAALMFLLGYNYTEGFLLATNLKGAGAFDDIIFQYEGRGGSRGEKVKRICFIQLKHKQKDGVVVPRSELLSLQGGFSLRKLYGSFREVSGQFSMSREHKVFNGSLEESEFFLYTNAQIDRGSQNESFKECAVPDLRGEYNRVFSFNENSDFDVYTLFQDLSAYKLLLDDLCKLSETGNEFDNMIIKEKIKRYVEEHPNREIAPKLNRLKNKPSKKEFEKLLKEIADLGDVSTYKQFLSKLTVFSNQAGKADLDAIIEFEIKKACHTSPLQTKAIAKEMFEELQEWRRTSNDYLNENAPFWNKILQKRINKISELNELSEWKEMQKLDLKFSDTAIENIMFSIKNNTITNIVTDGNSTFTMIKVAEALKSLKITALILSLKDFMVYRSDVLSICPSRWCSTLVIEVSRELELDFEKFRNIFTDGTLSTCSFKVVIISSNTMSVNLGETQTSFSDSTSFKDLDSPTQNNILDRTVLFQDYEVPLRSLMISQDSLTSLLNSDNLLQLLINEETMVLGQNLTDRTSIYVPRTLECKIVINQNILSQSEVTDIIAVCGLSKEKLNTLLHSKEGIGRFLHHAYYSNWFYQGPDDCKFVALEAEDLGIKKGFKELCKRFPTKNIHCLKFEDGFLTWLDSKGDSEFICKHIDAVKSGASCDQLTEYVTEKKLTSCSPNNVNEINDRVVLISAEPGMGKSTLLSHLALETKRTDPSLWIFRINLNDYSNFLCENKAFVDGDVECAVEFLISAAGLNKSQHSDLEKGLLKHFLLRLERAIVLLDGFDEISPTHAKTTVALIRTLCKTKIVKLWVTSRPVMKEYLQNELKLIAFKLQPFSEKDQEDFLRLFWKSRIEYIDETLLETFIKEFIDVTKKTLKDKNMPGIPLHTVMLAEAYEKCLVNFHSEEKFDFPEKLDLLELYDTFVEKKFQIYCKEKNKMDITKAGVNDDIENLRENFMNNHMISALKVFLTSEELNSVQGSETKKNSDAFIERIRSGKEKTGIVVQVSGGIPQFVHRTFAEYFVSKWLAQNYIHNKTLLIRVLFMESYDVISNIFNHILARGFDLHVAVLNHDVKAIQKMLQTDECSVNCVDRGGRTALHLAAAEYNRGGNVTSDFSRIGIIAELLISSGVKCDSVDGVLGWTALRYADMAGASWGLIERLLGTDGSNPDDLENTKLRLADGNFKDKLLCEIVEHGYVKLAEFILINGASVNHTLTSKKFKFDRYTLLHGAARYGRLTLVAFLIKHGADVLARDRWGATALHRAAQYNQLEVVQYLLEIISIARNWLIQRLGSRASPQKDIVNIADEDGDTPLHHAARGGALDVVRYLVQQKLTNVNACNSDGETAFVVAERSLLRNGGDTAEAVVRYMTSVLEHHNDIS
ncbi:hypothetical protein C0J52_25668 [Blattella germanica]|nr:hypothetical protein C0J52_25668 [Blattella germanica]